ncbi:hypothetical protein HGA34_00180 [Candidatus Falkowbacteria bacterium]|nr:hypothetical protein [Candidatus Falkowbacteria bacterium]
MQTLRKVIALSVIFVTVLSLSVVVAPQASAAASAGDLIKMDGLSSVYYLGGDGKRYVFPNEQTYFSWYSDFSSVMTIPQAELESYPLGANVTIRPGTKLVKITTNPKVYAVTPGGNLVAVPDEATAKALYGDNWAKRIVDVPDAFFTNYKVSASSLTATAYPEGSLIKTAASPDIYYITATGAASKVASESAFTGNRFKFSDVITTALAIPTMGAEISGVDTKIADTSSGAGGTVYTGGSGVTVALSGMTPASASVPKNGARVPMAKVNLTAANDGAVTVSSLNLKRIGLSSYNQIDKVWAEKDGVIVASKKTINSNDEASLTFSPALVISAGQTVTIELLASLVNASGNIGLSVVSATAGGANIAGLPVNGNLMAPIDYTVTNLAITNPSTATSTVKVGDEKVELGKFTVEFNGTAKDVTLKSVMLKNNGIEDLAKTSMNLYLEYNGTKVSESAKVDGRFVTFFFPATGLDLLKDDTSKILLVKGDIIAKENTAINSYAFVINKSTDVVAYEKSTGFGVNVYNASTGSTVADNRFISDVTITSGVVSISKKSTSPADTTIIKGSDNTILLANIRADEAISADGLNLVYGSSASAAATVDQFENVRVYLNGTLLDSFDITATSGSMISKNLSSSLTLNKGDNEVKVMVKAKTTATAGAAFLAKVDGTAFTSQNPQYVSSGNAVSTGDISGTATGAVFTVQGAALATVRNDGYSANKVVVKGATDVSLGKFALKATNDEIKVTSISLGANASSTLASSIYDAKLFVGGVQVGNTVDFGTSGATFSSLNFVIAKDTTKAVEIKASFDSSATGGFQTTMTVNGQDSRGTAITGGAGITQATSQIFSIQDAGTLKVELGGNAPQAAILAAKGAEQSVAEYKFTAINDSASLTEINFVNTSSSTAIATSSAVDSSVAAIALYDGATLLDSTVLVSGIGRFLIDGKALVPANGSKTLTIKVSLNSISNDATATDKDLQIVLTDVKFKSSAGTLTGPQFEGDIANGFRIRKTVPTVALQALPETLLTAGDKVVSKFTVTADANGDVTLGKVVLTYATTTNSSVATIANNAVKVNGSTKDFAATVSLANKTITVDFGATPEVISAGSSKTFEILSTVSVSGNGSESVTTKIVEDATYATGATTAVAGSFIWSDGADISAFTYSNGKRVPGLTTPTQTLSK